MGRLPHYLSYGAPSTHALRARVELRYSLCKCISEHDQRRPFTDVSSPDFSRGRGNVCTQAREEENRRSLFFSLALRSRSRALASLVDVFGKNEEKNKTTSIYRLMGERLDKLNLLFFPKDVYRRSLLLLFFFSRSTLADVSKRAKRKMKQRLCTGEVYERI